MRSSVFATPVHRRLTSFLVVVAATLGLGSTTYAQSTAVPEFTGDRVYLVGNPRGIDAESLKREIAKIEKSSRQTYFVVTAKNTGPGADSTKRFMDRLADQWPAQARQRETQFDIKRVVIIVVGIENRKIVVLGGTELQQKFAFRDPAIDRELVRPYFTPIAQKGDMNQALRVLLDQIDRWITAKDKDQALRQSEIAARSLQLRKEAEAAIAEGRRELTETRTSLQARHAEGLITTDMDAQIAQVANQLDSATAKLNGDPAEALDLTRQANRILAEAAESIRRIPLLRTELDVRLTKAQETVSEIAKAIETAHVAGIATARQEKDMDQARTALDSARGLITTDPLKAETLVNEGEGRLRDVLIEARSLPAVAAELATLKSAANKSFDEALSITVLARKKGIKLGDAAPAVREFEKSLLALRDITVDDPATTLSAYRETSEAAKNVLRLVPPKLARHTLLYRTIPLSGLAGLGLLGTGIAGLSWRARRKFRAEVLAQFENYRTRAVALMDRLDDLRKEHAVLMKVDPDFVEPSTGRTLAVYAEVENDLAVLWDKWLVLMDVWERADKLVRNAGSLSSEQIDKAKSLLETEGDFKDIDAKVENCRVRLDSLGHAHEDARKQVAAAEDKVGALQKLRAELESRQIRVSAFAHALTGVEQVLAEARGLIVADPLGATESVAKADTTLNDVSERIATLMTLLRKSETLRTTADAIRHEATQLRQGGLLLKEGAADPDPKLKRAETMLDRAEAELQKPAPESAAKLLAEVESVLTGAAADMKRHQEARHASLTAIPETEAAYAALVDSIRKNEAALAQMTQSFAASSFQDVADNVTLGERTASDARDLLDQARSAAADDTQKYMAAMDLTRAASETILRAEAAVQAIGQRYAQLRDAADRFRGALPGLEAKERETKQLFDESREIIGDEARKSLEQALKAARRVDQAATVALADWPEAERLLQAALKGLELAASQASEDIEGHKRLVARERSVRERMQTVGRSLERGDMDRPPANQRYRQAAELLRHYDAEAGTSARDWDERLRWLDEIASNADRAEELANQDINLANGALAEIDSASATLRKSQAYYKAGISADMSRAEALLEQARGSLASQAYEAAIEAAQASEHAASVALNSAENQARKRRMQADRTVVLGDPVSMGGLFDVLIRAGAEISRHSSSQGSSSSGDWGSSSSSGGWSSGGSSGSWGSGSSSSSWDSGGSSGGSWSSGSSQSSW